MPDVILQPTLLSPETASLLHAERRDPTSQQANAIRQLLSGRMLEKYTPEEYRDVYRKVAITLPYKINPEAILSEMAKIRSQITVEANQKAFMHNARIFLQELMLTDTAHEKFGELKKYLRENPKCDLASMDLSTDPIVKAFADFIRNENAETRKEIYEEARMAAMHEYVVTAKNDYVDKKKEQKDKVNQAIESSSAIDLDHYLKVELSTASSKKVLQKRAAAVASDLKNQQFAMLMAIKPSELQNNAWVGSHREQRAPNVVGIIDFYNSISARIEFDILNATSEKHQQRIYNFYTHVLDESMKQQDFQTAAAIVAGMNNAAITRLPHLKDTKGLLAKHEATLDMKNNFRLLKAELNSPENEAAIPLMMLYVKDLAAISENNPEVIETTLDPTTDENTTTLNVIKCELLGKLCDDLQKRQEKAAEYFASKRESSLVSVTNMSTRTKGFSIDDSLADSISQEILPRAVKSRGGASFQSGRSHSAELFETTRASQSSSASEVQGLPQVVALPVAKSLELPVVPAALAAEPAKLPLEPILEPIDFELPRAELSREQKQTVVKNEILEKALNTFLEIGKGKAGSSTIMRQALAITRELRKINNDATLNAEEKGASASVLLQEATSNPNLSPHIVKIADSYATMLKIGAEPPATAAPPVPPSGIELAQKALSELEETINKHVKQMAEESQQAKTGQKLPESARELASERASDSVAVQEAGVHREVEEAKPKAPKMEPHQPEGISPRVMRKEKAEKRARAAFAELESTEESHRSIFISDDACNQVLQEIEVEIKKLKQKEIPPLLQNLKNLLTLSKELNQLSFELSIILAKFEGNPNNLSENNSKALQVALTAYAQKLAEFSMLYDSVLPIKNDPKYTKLNQKIMSHFPIANPGDTSFYEKFPPAVQRGTRFHLIIDQLIRSYPAGTPEAQYWQTLQSSVTRISEEAQDKLMQTHSPSSPVGLAQPNVKTRVSTVLDEIATRVKNSQERASLKDTLSSSTVGKLASEGSTATAPKRQPPLIVGFPKAPVSLESEESEGLDVVPVNKFPRNKPQR